MKIVEGLFIITLILELTFLVYCIIQKNNFKTVKLFIKITPFLLFILGIYLSIIQWSFRWYLFVLILMIQIVIEIICSFKKEKKKKEFRSLLSIRTFVIAVIIYSIGLFPAYVFPQHEVLPVTGQYGINTVTYTYVDETRVEKYSDKNENRKLNVQFWYPDVTKSEKNTYPFIVFSHGAMGVKTSNLSLYRELASHGYVVCAIDHTYQSLYTKDNKGKITLLSKAFMKELMGEDVDKDINNSLNCYQKWMEIETSDIDFVIDTVVEDSKLSSNNGVYDFVDATKIGVIGHSLGGSAALGIGRNRKDIKAVVALESPYMCDITGIEQDDFTWIKDKYPIPVLNIYTDSSWEKFKSWKQYAENIRLLSSKQENVYNIYIKGANHFSLTDLSLSSPLLTTVLGGQKPKINTEYCLNKVNKICLEFFNHYLKQEGNFEVRSTDSYK